MEKFNLPRLSYPYDAFVPHIDARTMEIHHTKHHQGYVNQLNEAAAAFANFPTDLKTVMFRVEEYNTAIRNNGGGHYNHSFFWESLLPGGKTKVSGSFKEAMLRDFGSQEKLEVAFAKNATTLFGSGWTWLCTDLQGLLHIVNTPNQDNPLMYYATRPWHPVLGLDVWEHAYYLTYQNRRQEYVKAFWHIVDWDKVGERYSEVVAYNKKKRVK